MNAADEQDAKDIARRSALALRTAAMQELDTVEEGLSDLAAKYKGVVYDVNSTEGMSDAKAARAAIREPRYKAENIRKEKTSQLSKLGKEINERAAAIKDRILALESPIDKQIKAEEDRKEAEREAKRQAEAERIAAMNARLDNIRNMPLQAVGATADELAQAIDRVAADELDGFDEVYLPTAEQTKATALDALRAMLNERQELDRQQEELARLRKEKEAREEEARVKAEAEAAARRAAQEKEDAERAVRHAEEDRKRAEQAEADRIERERVAAEQKARQDELDRAAAEQRQRDEEAAQAQREAQEKEDKERRDREAAEEAAAAQERAQAAARASRLEKAAPDLLAALEACRAQWIHSVNAAQCLAAIAKATQEDAQ